MIKTDAARLRVDVLAAAALFFAGTLISYSVMRVFRTIHSQPFFYQETLGPAVLMACGYGFQSISVEQSPPRLHSFLTLGRDDFNCADLPPSTPLQPVTWSSTSYYQYAAIALIWKATRISWTALDGLVAVFGGIVTASLYGLFRFVAGPWIAAAMAMVQTVAPPNLTTLPILRDYSKAPFVLAAVFVLALTVFQPMRTRSVLLLTALYGGIVAIGYGFRPDLLIMLPFGILVLMALLPASAGETLRRRLSAAAVALVSFVVIAAPALRGLGTGGCQFHFPLLGLTAPFTTALNLEPSIYSLGDHFTDTFVDLKTGDYADRVLGSRPPLLCSAEYDTASGRLFWRLARTFPADLIARAYASALVTLRAGVTVPTLPGSFSALPWLKSIAVRLNSATAAVSIAGPIVALLAVGAAWTFAPRLGVAVAVFFLFLSGYPAIEFEPRHWFHLRFIPIWAALLVLKRLSTTHHSSGSTRPLWQGAGVSLAVVLLLAFVLATARAVQAREVSAMVRSYEAALVDDLPTTSPATSSLDVSWRSRDYGPPPSHRSSDLLAVTIEANGCGGSGPIDLRIRYDSDLPTHDVSSTVVLERAQTGSSPTRLFFPIFSQGVGDRTYLRFAGVDVPGRPTDCISRVARVSDRTQLPLWVQLQVPPGWSSRPLYQRLQVLEAGR